MTDEIRNALVVEDSPQILERLVEVVAVPGRVKVVAAVATEDAAAEALERFRIDFAVVDLQLGQGTGFGVVRRLRDRGRPPCAILVITNHAVPALKVAAFEAGADFFMDKAHGLDQVRKAIAVLLAPAEEES